MCVCSSGLILLQKVLPAVWPLLKDPPGDQRGLPDPRRGPERLHRGVRAQVCEATTGCVMERLCVRALVLVLMLWFICTSTHCKCLNLLLGKGLLPLGHIIQPGERPKLWDSGICAFMCVYVLIIVQNWLQWLQRMYPWVCVCISRYFLLRFVPGARTLTEAETKSFISAADDDSDGRIGVQGRYLSSYLLFVILQACIIKPFCCRGQNESILWAQI